jgi:hypothetical protein
VADRDPGVPLPERRRDVGVASGNEFEVESIEVEEAACIAQR